MEIPTKMNTLYRGIRQAAPGMQRRLHVSYGFTASIWADTTKSTIFLQRWAQLLPCNPYNASAHT